MKIYSPRNFLSILFIFFVLFFSNHTKAQSNCPEGYEQRNVKCNGSIVVKCVPKNYNCSRCWAIEWPPCPGGTYGGMDNAATYLSAFTYAQRVKNSTRHEDCNVYGWDNRSYTIYLDDSEYCTNRIDEKTAIKDDLLKKIQPFLQRYKDEIENYRRYYKQQPYKPGAVFREYATQLEQALENVRQLEVMLKNISDANLSELENAFDKLKAEETDLKIATSNFKNNLNIANQEKNRQEYNRKEEQQHPEPIRESRTKSAAELNYLAGLRYIQESQNRTSNIYEQALRVENVLLQVIKDRAADREEERRYAAEQRRKEAEREAEERRKEAEREEEERREKAEAEAIKQNNILSWQTKGIAITGNQVNLKKTTDINDVALKSVFYIIWQFSSTNQFIIFKPIAINKSLDGDWITLNDFAKKIEKQTQISLNYTPDGIYTEFNKLNNLMGYYATKEEANEQYLKLITNAEAKGYSVLKKEIISEPKIKRSFWEEKTIPKQKTEKSFWDEK
jgi:hypothetical protein